MKNYFDYQKIFIYFQKFAKGIINFRSQCFHGFLGRPKNLDVGIGLVQFGYRKYVEFRKY